MGFFSWVKEKTSQAVGWVKEKSEQVVNWTREKIQEVKEATISVVENIGETLVRWGNKITDTVKKPNIYTLEQTDVEAGQKAIDTIERHFPSGIKETLETQSGEQRIETFHELAQDAISDMQLDETNLDIQIVPPRTEEEKAVLGYFSNKDNTLYINAEFIVCDNLELAKEQVYTIYHELMHARQWAAVCSWASTPPGDTLGYSKDKILEYVNNFAYYIQPEWDREAYRCQPIETSAYGFETELKNRTN